MHIQTLIDPFRVNVELQLRLVLHRTRLHAHLHAPVHLDPMFLLVRQDARARKVHPRTNDHYINLRVIR